ncbi:hypothetical protein L1887_23668 [Cichorium endivia]|nr:hypothetical protein L1887_23668 [Cichorium endivia]
MIWYAFFSTLNTREISYILGASVLGKFLCDMAEEYMAKPRPLPISYDGAATPLEETGGGDTPPMLIGGKFLSPVLRFHRWILFHPVESISVKRCSKDVISKDAQTDESAESQALYSVFGPLGPVRH